METGTRPCPDGLYRRNSSVVYSYLRCHVRSPADAEDLTAEVFEAAMRGLTTFDSSRGTERAWILGIAHSRIVRFWRIESRRDRVDVNPDHLTSPHADPQERLLLSERRVQLLGAMAMLAPRDRHVITLRCLAELRAGEVARILGISCAHVAVVLHRARKRLAVFLTSNRRAEEDTDELIDPAGIAD